MSCSKCKKRSLAQIANDAFKDARAAKAWLRATDVPGLDGKKPIEAIAEPGADHAMIFHALRTAARQYHMRKP